MAPILYWHEIVYKPTPWATVHATSCTGAALPDSAPIFAPALATALGRELRRRHVLTFEFGFHTCCEADEARKQRWEDVYADAGIFFHLWTPRRSSALRACCVCLSKNPHLCATFWLQAPSRAPVRRMHSTSLRCRGTRSSRKRRIGTRTSTCAGGSSDPRKAPLLTMPGKHV